jgi:hypothetical protein
MIPRSERYARHVNAWRSVGFTPLTEMEYHYPVHARAAWLLYANMESRDGTPELLRAVERAERAIVHDSPNLYKLLWEVASGEWSE